MNWNERSLLRNTALGRGIADRSSAKEVIRLINYSDLLRAKAFKLMKYCVCFLNNDPPLFHISFVHFNILLPFPFHFFLMFIQATQFLEWWQTRLPRSITLRKQHKNRPDWASIPQRKWMLWIRIKHTKWIYVFLCWSAIKIFLCHN